MNTLLFVAIIVSSLTNGILVMCFVPNGENVDLLLSPKSEPYSIQEDSEHNDRSVYDRGVGKLFESAFFFFIWHIFLLFLYSGFQLNWLLETPQTKRRI